MEKTFKIKFQLFGFTKAANIKANTLEEAKNKLNKAILAQVKILPDNYTKPKTSIYNTLKNIFGELPIHSKLMNGLQKKPSDKQMADLNLQRFIDLSNESASPPFCLSCE